MADAVNTQALAGLASIAASGNDTATAISFTAGSTGRVLQLSADNDGTPSSGDILDIYALYSVDESPTTYDTVGHAALLGSIDTNEEDPGIKSFPLRDGVTGVKIYLVNTSAGRAITPTGSIVETDHSA